MPFDLDTLLGSDPSGLLTPQERGGVTGQGLMGMGAALLKAAAPSPYKHTTLSGLGEGVSGLLSGRQSATDELLKQHLVRAKTIEGALPLFKQMQDRASTGMPMEPWEQRLMQNILPALGIQGGIGAGVPGAPGAAPGLGRGAPGGVSPQPGAPAATGASAQGGGFQIPSDWRPPPQSPGALPPTDIRQYHADMNGFNRRATLPGAPGNAAYEKSFEESHAGFPGGAAGYALQQARDAQEKQDITEYGKKYTGIKAMGQIASSVNQYAKIGEDLLDGGIYSGAGAESILAWKKLMVLLGRDPNTPNDTTSRTEVFNKVMSEGLLGRIQELQALNKEYGEAGGRSLLTVINTMGKANPNLDLTVPANRFLLNQAIKESQRHMDITDAATDFKIAHPANRLDAKWDKIHDQMLRKDIYSEEERRGIRGTQLPGSAPSPVLQGPPAPPPGPAPIPPMGRPGGGFGAESQPSPPVGGPLMPNPAGVSGRQPFSDTATWSAGVPSLARRGAGTVPFSDQPGGVPSATPFNARTRAAPGVAAGTKADPVRLPNTPAGKAHAHALKPGTFYVIEGMPNLKER